MVSNSTIKLHQTTSEPLKGAQYIIVILSQFWQFSEADPANLAELLDRLDREEFDLIAVGRALISNPDWATHVKNNEEGKIIAFKKEHLGTLV